jgi:hypothetical protein
MMGEGWFWCKKETRKRDSHKEHEDTKKRREQQRRDLDRISGWRRMNRMAWWVGSAGAATWYIIASREIEVGRGSERCGNF